MENMNLWEKTIRNANIYTPFGPSNFVMTKEISVQRILFAPFRNFVQREHEYTHYTRRFHSGNQITLTQILTVTQTDRNWTI